MATLLVLGQSSGLDEDGFQPLLMHLQVVFGVSQVGVDEGESVCEYPVDQSRLLVVKLRVDARRAEPDDCGDLGPRLRHAEVHQGDNDGLCGVLSDMGVRYVVIAGDSGEDCVGVLQT